MHSPQSWDPERYARNARFVSDLGMPVVELLAPQPGERVLDLGCGDGVLTEKLAALGCDVVGIDGSAAQIEAVRARGIDARVMDGQELTFGPEFDAVFSNAAMHWMRRGEAVVRGVHNALKPGGRFVAEFGGAGCVEVIRSTLIAALDRRGVDGKAADPWYFPTDQEYRQLLEANGFDVSYIALIPRPTPLPGDVGGWLETFAESFISKLPREDRPVFVDEVRETLRPKLCNAAGQWTADYVRLRFNARKTAV
ncbi:MAG: class I SAM-dependent methyltransferase [Deltaproteobacteria bacterium]|nr:class I SAM-dependent methyltransferase [Deltaproteobacteria bacterium]